MMRCAYMEMLMERSPWIWSVVGVGVIATMLCLLQSGCIQFHKAGSPETLKYSTDYKIGHRDRARIDLFVIDSREGILRLPNAFGDDCELYFSRQFDRRHGMWPSVAPESIDEYRADPGKWKYVLGVLPAGATVRFLGVAVETGNPEAGDLALPVGVIENGPLAGKSVSLMNISRDDPGCGLRIDKGVMEEVTPNP